MNLQSLMMRRFAFLMVCLGVLLTSPVGWAEQQWTVPTAEELAMTSQAGAAGAPAVVLYKEETSDDSLRMFSYYVRLKVLTEGGKDRANVELPFVGSYTGYTIDSIAGRTIHPDGSVVMFEGKPYDKLIEKAAGYKLRSKVFTLPSVEVGSILEYRFKIRYDQAFIRTPEWMIQDDLYVRKAHYDWRPTIDRVGNNEEGLVTNIAWMPVLPAGVEVKQAATNARNGQREFMLDVNNVPALVHEKLMPPAESLSYRVLFYWTSATSKEDYWRMAGKRWANAQNQFVGPGRGVKEFVEKTVAANDTPDQKLRKLYDAVMKMENTDFTRERTTKEEKAAGLKEVVTTADDILKRQRGNGDQLAGLFVSMARAAGFKAYVMGVANRNKRVFLSAYLSLSQLDDDIAIVSVDGQEQFFDPGQRYCEFKHLAWIHAGSGGLRQTDAGTVMGVSPGETYKTAHVLRVADLTLDERGEATGTVKMTYNGDPALAWRQESLRGDDTGLRQDLKAEMERLLPGGMEVKITNVQDLENYNKPLVIEYDVKGAVGAGTGKRMLVQGNLFQANGKPTFPESAREQVVYLPYPSYYQDAVRIRYPAGMAVESAPAAEQSTYREAALYATSSKQAQGSVTTFRNMEIAECIYGVKEYPGLRAFYSKLEAKDQEPVVLIRAAGASAAVGAGSGAGK